MTIAMTSATSVRMPNSRKNRQPGSLASCSAAVGVSAGPADSGLVGAIGWRCRRCCERFGRAGAVAHGAQASAFSSASSADVVVGRRHPRPRPSSLASAAVGDRRRRRPPRGRRPRRLVVLVGVLGLGLLRGQRRRLHRGELRVVEPALLDPRLLPAQLAEVVELRAADPAAADDLELRDGRRVHRERPLHADAERDLADGERLAQAAVLSGGSPRPGTPEPARDSPPPPARAP